MRDEGFEAMMNYENWLKDVSHHFTEAERTELDRAPSPEEISDLLQNIPLT